MEREITIKGEYLYIPVQAEKEESWLEVFSGDDKCFEFTISWGREGKYDYAARVRLPQNRRNTFLLKGDFDEKFFDLVQQLSKEDQPEEGLNPHFQNGEEVRPALHFTAQYGWINDPNGLVFDGEKYHLYFQHNPFNTQWNNMSWGHATTSDFVHYEQYDDVMFPDENGTMFSGCGLMKEGKLLFPYTVAGATSPWSEGKPFYQGLAESTDGGLTLEKVEKPFLAPVGKDSRDPKIFWHEETQAYIMILYLEDYDFGIFRSKDLESFEMTQRFTIEPAWECPDLLRVPDEDGSEKWMFISADGFYYWGDFDGYEFTSDFVKHDAIVGGKHYATQTYWGIKDRIVAVPWLRLEVGKYYRGAMGIPREYTSVTRDGFRYLVQKPVREIRELFKEDTDIPKSGPYMVDVKDFGNHIDLKVNGSTVELDNENKSIIIDGERFELPVSVSEINIIMDLNIMEIAFDNVILIGHRTLNSNNELCINWREDGNTKGCGSEVRTDCHYSIKSIK